MKPTTKACSVLLSPSSSTEPTLGCGRNRKTGDEEGRREEEEAGRGMCLCRDA